MLRGLFHTGITVSDLEESIRFCRDVLGLELLVAPTQPFGGEQFSIAQGLDGAVLRVAIFKVGEERLELLEYSTPEPLIVVPVPRTTVGASHVAFRVDDIEAKVSELAGRGVEFFSEIQVVDDGPLCGWHWVYFSGPEGITMELVELDERATAV